MRRLLHLEGRSYINFHAVQFGCGEIRGQILAVPEPPIFPLMLFAGIADAAARRRRR